VFDHCVRPLRREHPLPRREAAGTDLRTAGSCRTPARGLRAATGAATRTAAGLRTATARAAAGLRTATRTAAGLRTATAREAECRVIVAQHLATHKEQKLIY